MMDDDSFAQVDKSDDGALDLSFQTQRMPTPNKFGSDQNAMVKTDPNSVYRQVFNRDLSFFLFVIDNIDPPIHIKLHLTTVVQHELTDAEMIHSMRTYLRSIDESNLAVGAPSHNGGASQQQRGPENPPAMTSAAKAEMYSRQTWIEVKQYPQKQQVKIFIKLHDGSKERAKFMFQRFYKASEIPIYDGNGVVKYHRKMRAYLVKDEGTMEQLAKAKFFDDLKKK